MQPASTARLQVIIAIHPCGLCCRKNSTHALAESINLRTRHFFSPMPRWRILHDPPFQREYVYEPFLLVNHLFPIRCYETWGPGGGSVNSFPPWWMAAQLYAPKLTGGRLYFSFIARRCPASAWELSGPLLSASSAGPEEEYLIRRNGIRVIWFQKHL